MNAPKAGGGQAGITLIQSRHTRLAWNDSIFSDALNSQIR